MATDASYGSAEHRSGETIEVQWGSGTSLAYPLRSVERIIFGADGAIILTHEDSLKLYRLRADFYVGLLITVVSLTTLAFFLYVDVPAPLRQAFIYGVMGLTAVSLRAGYLLGLVRGWLRR